MAEPSVVTILVGRFPDLLSRGLCSLVEGDPSLELVAGGVGPGELRGVLGGIAPRVAVLDAQTLHAPAEVRELTARHPSTQLLLLTDGTSSVEAAQLLSFGAAACLHKGTEERDVLNAIHLASRGLRLIPRSAEARGGSGLLTPREADVLAELQRRRSNAQIAADLCVSVETVRTHARHIYRKLGVASRRDLTAPGAG